VPPNLRFRVDDLSRRGVITLKYPDFVAVQKIAAWKEIIWIIENKGKQTDLRNLGGQVKTDLASKGRYLNI
jgi:hypothetical protein